MLQKIKILFIAYANSSHTHSWVELLEGQWFDVRVFGIEDIPAPAIFTFPTVTISNYFPDAEYTLEKEAESLAKLISDWQPDIIHTLGLYPAAFIYYSARQLFNLQHVGKWIVTARGGPDIALHRLIPDEASKISLVLRHCDQFIADNIQNYQYAISLGLSESKLSPAGVLPGTGGVDCDTLSQLSTGKPSERERSILWPKAYECPASKALPVFEALKLCWEKIRPCTIYLTAVEQLEIRYWFETLPAEIKSNCILLNRIERNSILKLMGSVRVLLAPSLTDGIPNSLYEAMSTGAVPVFSPLETIQTVISEGNAIFARNLYPHEIAVALDIAMNNDVLANEIAQRNYKLVRKLANRETIRSKAIMNYIKLALQD